MRRRSFSRPSLSRPSLFRPSPLAVVTAAVPVVAICAALLTDATIETDPVDRRPTEVPLSRTVLACPTGSDAGGVLLASATQEPGDVEVVVGGRGAEPERVAVTPGRRTTLDDATRVSGTGEMAPGLVAQRWSTPGLRAVDCPATSSDQWFTGVGAGAEHTSVLELHNPDSGPATATITVLGQSGPVGAGGALRGISVAGGATVRLDLASAIPKREELALHLTTERGRLAATVIDAFVPIGRGQTTKEYLAGQREPGTSHLLMGVPERVQDPAVVVANTSDSVARVSLRLVTSDSTFAPTGLKEVLVDPESVHRFSIARLLGSEAAQGVLGVQVVSSQPTTATFRGRVRGDLVTVPGPRGPRRGGRRRRPGPAQGRPGPRRASRPALVPALVLLWSCSRPALVLGAVARVDVARVEAEQLGDLLHDHGEHQRLQVAAALGAVLQRPAEEHQARGLVADRADQ